MKKIMFLTAILVSICSIAIAQQKRPVPGASLSPAKHAVQSHDKDIPSVVHKSFARDMPYRKAGWRIDGPNYVADYCDSLDVRHTITYDPDGKVVSRQEVVTGKQYPAVIEEFYTRQYPGERFTIWQRTDAEGVMMYYFTRGEESIWFNSEGDYVSTTENKLVR